MVVPERETLNDGFIELNGTDTFGNVALNVATCKQTPAPAPPAPAPVRRAPVPRAPVPRARARYSLGTEQCFLKNSNKSKKEYLQKCQ